MKMDQLSMLEARPAPIDRPLVKWFGSKWAHSAYMPKPIGDVVIEPFAGSACYSTRHFRKDVILAECHNALRETWKWLTGPASRAEIESIPVELSVGADLRQMGLSSGQELLLKHWQRTNNVSNCFTVSPWGNKPGQWTESTRSSVANAVEQIKHWRIEREGFDLLEGPLAADPAVTWFIDPVYKYNYNYGIKNFGHGRLAAAVNNIRGFVIVCEATCPKTGAKPDYLPFHKFSKMITSRRAAGANNYSEELLYIQEPQP
jgi:hypothetical protein